LRINGGRRRTRTFDPLIKSQLLYQLSYAPETALRRHQRRRSRKSCLPPAAKPCRRMLCAEPIGAGAVL
jgi:hypothetical protein